MLILGLIALVVVIPISINHRVLRVTLASICLVGAVVAGFIVISYVGTGNFSGYAVGIRDAYLVIAHVLGISAVVSMLYVIASRRPRWWWWTVPAVLFATLGLALARGALLSGLSIGILGALYFHSQGALAGVLRPRIRGIGGKLCSAMVLGGVCTAAVLVAMSVERTATRLARMFLAPERELEAGGRGRAWETAWEAIQNAPIVGHGLGSYEVLSGLSYPHNLFLQVWLDGGIVAVIILLMIIGAPFGSIMALKLRSKNNATMWLPFAGAYLFTILEYSKSMNFYGARTLFITGVLTVCSATLVYCKRE